MSTYEDKKIDFLFSVFAEVNEHIRATDEKNVLIAGSYVALIAVVLAVLMDKMDKINTFRWIHLGFSLFILLIGSCVYMLQLWYRRWKEHYLRICYNIALKFKLEEKLQPVWLTEPTKKRVSADKILLLIPLLINISILSYSLYLLLSLIKCSPLAEKVITFCYLSLYFLLLFIAERKLISKLIA